MILRQDITLDADICDGSVRQTKIETATIKKPTRSVSFAGMVHVRPIPSNEDLADELWWNARDFQYFKRRCREDLDMLQQTDEEEWEVCCFRGLESFARAKLKHTRRAIAFQAVMEEQLVQWEDDSENPEFISEVYRKASLECEKEAHLIGLKDMQDAIQVFQEIIPATPTNSPKFQSRRHQIRGRVRSHSIPHDRWAVPS